MPCAANTHTANCGPAAHRDGIVEARAHWTTRIATSLTAVVGAVRDSRALSNFDRVVDPINAPKIIMLTNDVNHAVAGFAERADLDLIGVDEQELWVWSEAAKTLVGDAAACVGSAGSSVANRVKRFGAHLQERRDSGALARAD